MIDVVDMLNDSDLTKWKWLRIVLALAFAAALIAGAALAGCTGGPWSVC